jgi:glyoxylase-like metal-dependent hydrolase (beta-lactamase superfamily II)
MSMKIKAFVVGPIDVNCYILQDDETGHGLIIDPGGSGEAIWHYLQQEKISVAAIVNTHAHGDHLGAVDYLRAKTGAPFCLDEREAPLLADAKKNLSAFMGFALTVRPADCYLRDGQVIKAGHLSFKVLATPGHSPGGICLYGEKLLFSGDSLFQGAIGRCDFPGSSESQLIHGLLTKIMILPDDTKVYPGHGPASTIGWEKRHNPYLS